MVKEELDKILGEIIWVLLKKVKLSLIHLSMLKIPNMKNPKNMSKLWLFLMKFTITNKLCQCNKSIS